MMQEKTNHGSIFNEKAKPTNTQFYILTSILGAPISFHRNFKENKIKKKRKKITKTLSCRMIKIHVRDKQKNLVINNQRIGRPKFIQFWPTLHCTIRLDCFFFDSVNQMGFWYFFFNFVCSNIEEIVRNYTIEGKKF